MADNRTSHDNFLADAISPRSDRRLGYTDGLRFGIGFFAAGLLSALVLGALTWGFVLAFHH